MKKNVGRIDVIIRIVLAVIFAVLYFSGVVTGTFGYVLLGLAAISVLTSFMGRCPLYSIFGINTCPMKK